MGKKREQEDLGDVEVERMPNLDGWEYFKAVDAADERERWTLALRPDPAERTVAFALFTDIKKDATATGLLDGRKDKKERWASAMRKAIESTDDGGLDDRAREEITCAILAKHDPDFEEYEDRLLFDFEPPDLHDEGDPEEEEED
ncbi:MAG: hypothetical protein HOW73_32690 [Polyangiaceae bacterium]|nr:hypothetical protein [Polyangiaceae bacterium]